MDAQAMPRSRRAILAGAIGGLAAFAASAVGRPSPVRAADVVLGGTNSSASTTTIKNATDADPVLSLASEDGTALITTTTAQEAIFSRSSGGPGVRGIHGPRTILSGASHLKVGVLGEGPRAGVRGIGTDGRAGVYGSIGTGAPELPPNNVGVYGWSTTNAGVSYGVVGRSTAQGGIGVLGTSADGVGVSAFSTNGTALFVQGRMSLSTSGIGQILSGNASAQVDPGTPIDDDTRLLVTLHGNPGGNTALQRVTKDAAGNTFTVMLTAPAANTCKFSWLIIG